LWPWGPSAPPRFLPPRGGGSQAKADVAKTNKQNGRTALMAAALAGCARAPGCGRIRRGILCVGGISPPPRGPGGGDIVQQLLSHGAKRPGPPDRRRMAIGGGLSLPMDPRRSDRPSPDLRATVPVVGAPCVGMVCASAPPCGSRKSAPFPAALPAGCAGPPGVHGVLPRRHPGGRPLRLPPPRPAGSPPPQRGEGEALPEQGRQVLSPSGRNVGHRSQAKVSPNLRCTSAASAVRAGGPGGACVAPDQHRFVSAVLKTWKM